jgi:anti-sigma regulatory factor (Ser/Thr protein kinase)
MHPPRADIRFPATHDGFAQGFSALRCMLDTERLDEASRYRAELVFEEIVANIVNHGAQGRDIEVSVTVEARPEAIVLTFEDEGAAFDPSAHREPVRQRSLEDEKPGGFGLMLVRRAATSLDYLRTVDGRNRSTVRIARGAQLPDASAEADGGVQA